MKKINGFTLLEVLIALTVLSISMLGVYSLLNISLTMENRRNDREYLFQFGFERLLKEENFKKADLKEAERIMGHSISYDKEADQIELFDEKELKELLEKAKSKDFSNKLEIIENKITTEGRDVYYYTISEIK
ncbi:MAG: prepilin-type N-terminal cleavage/methylation domain-containing protein [Deferribacterota bacterium]|nr:prepilin-type N-terminal cleavage/methylation domain-containing protein [Deferribacterota bacterium]